MKPLAIAACLAAAACTMPYVDEGFDLTAAQVARCNYEASRATAVIPNGVLAGYERGELRRQCFALRRLENAPPPDPTLATDYGKPRPIILRGGAPI